MAKINVKNADVTIINSNFKHIEFDGFRNQKSRRDDTLLTVGFNLRTESCVKYVYLYA
jgi:hypothetical protein